MSNYVVNSQYFWTGVVEDTLDPMSMKRCKVRIFGVHGENVPTEKLPWATPLYPPGVRSYNSLLEGEYVVGYFQDGNASQVPIIVGVVPGVIPTGSKTSPIATSTSTITSKAFRENSSDPIKKDAPAGVNTGVQPGLPSVPAASRGQYEGTISWVTNKNLTPGCGVGLAISLTGTDFALINPTAAIQQAIKSGKNKAAQTIRMKLSIINENFRKVMDAILTAIGQDRTGQLSLSFSLLKQAVRKVNQITKKIVQAVEYASYYVGLVEQINNIVNYVKSLPKRFQALLQECVSQFLGSVNNLVNQVKSIPGAVNGPIESVLQTLKLTSEKQLADAKESANTAANGNPMANSISLIENSTDAANVANTIILEMSANANSTIANTTTYDPSTMKSP